MPLPVGWKTQLKDTPGLKNEKIILANCGGYNGRRQYNNVEQ